MSNQITLASANFVARQVNYQMTEGWGQGERATITYFRPLETFAERFDALLSEVKAMGFQALDLWGAHLNPRWATAEHIAIARDLLTCRQIQITSLASRFGDTREEVEASCRLAVALGTNILGGSCGLLGTNRNLLLAILQAHGVRLAVENHPEKTAQELLNKIGEGENDTICACVDTGWFGTQGFEAVQALLELRQYLVHVHLKDVLAVGTHETCRYGRGVVRIEKCVETLRSIGYTGAIGVEHEPEHFDPTEDCKANLQMLVGWLAPAAIG